MIGRPQETSVMFGMPVIEDEQCTRQEVRRVRGGYMNRWLIRQVVAVPTYYYTARFLVAHPLLVDQIRKRYGRSS